MQRFECDYAEGAHPRIMEALLQTNKEQTPGYGEDEYCEAARRMIKLACGREDMDVHFFVGGTQANATVIGSVLRPHQAVISAETGHIAGHEAGAVEATGHKVLALPAPDGKLTAAQVRECVETHWEDPNRVHTPQPAMVYLSQPTETGLLYTKAELLALREVCGEKKLTLYLDGARLGYALGAKRNDVFMADLAQLCDVFYIGGTKVGALFGEAVCICSAGLNEDFRYHIKQRGGMLAKGRLLGVQFETLFKDGLYLELGRHAVRLAMAIRDAFHGGGCAFLYDSPTNQQFPIVSEGVIAQLAKNYSFSRWKTLSDGKTAIRFVTSWATRPETVDVLASDIRRACRIHGDKAPVWSVEMPE
ncbi:MAG: low specificity L-threonine aldolase [Oscillospiraceae bacterium]|jgi:threonine aldolase|nr:low specificity L-threonine aldolase [Oscillospiraceae bacterium]